MNDSELKDAIKALRCIASSDREGDCYGDKFNFHLTHDQIDKGIRKDEKRMSCTAFSENIQECPYQQTTFGCCYEYGELYWLNDLADEIERRIKNEGVLRR